MSKVNKDNIVQSLERALVILEELARHKSGLGVTELSSILSLHKSTIHRLLGTFMLHGYVEQNDENDKYRLGVKVVLLGQQRLENTEIRLEARPYLNKLVEKTDETVHLCILKDGEIVYIDKVESSNAIRMVSRIGDRAPVHCTGVGKAILAFHPEEEARRILEVKGLAYKTPTTIVNMEEMFENLVLVRQKGYAFDEEEHQIGINCIASPIRDNTGKVCASVSLAGPASRVTKERINELSLKVIECATNISRELGFR